MTSDQQLAAEGVWLQYLARRLGGDTKPFEQLCEEFPQLADALQRCHDEWANPSPPGGADGFGAERAELNALMLRLARPAPRGRRYEVECDIGRGAMGVVQRVWDKDLRRQLAMKTMHAKVSGEWKQLAARFIEEAQIIAQLDHPSIVPVHDLGLDDFGRPFFVMKLVNGVQLSRVFELAWEGRDTWNTVRVLRCLLDVCEAVGYAHSKGVVHRDLKPSNIMVGPRGEVFVMDWGVARALGKAQLQRKTTGSRIVETLRSERTDDEAGSIFTAHGQIVGTAAYMSPEQARGEIERVDARSDVYAVGAMLYHFLGKGPPYGMLVDSSASVLEQLRAGPPASLRKRAPSVPAELIAICSKAMSRDPSLRYANLAECADDLRAFLDKRVVRAYEGGTWAETRKWVRRNLALASSFAAVLLVLSSLGTAFWIERARAEANADFVALLRTPRLATQLVREVAALWPAHPGTADALRNWMHRAEVLLGEAATDPDQNGDSVMGLNALRNRLNSLRGRAQSCLDEGPETESNRAELARVELQLQWYMRMLGGEPWPAPPPVHWYAGMLDAQPWYAPLELQSDPGFTTEADVGAGLVESGWPLVAPGRHEYGRELEGLRLIEQASAHVRGRAEATQLRALSWAQIAVGDFERARASIQKACEVRMLGPLFTSSSTRSPNISLSNEAGWDLEVEDAIDRWTGSRARARRRERDHLAMRARSLRTLVERGQTYKFETVEDESAYSITASAVAALEDLELACHGYLGDGVAAPFGWSAAKRISFAESIEFESRSGPRAREAWERAVSEIAASPLYGGLSLRPQIGLLPLGPDPVSGLWEFAHLQTGAPPERGADGRWIMSEETGLVFVLIPHTWFWMGAQWTQPDQPHYDPDAMHKEWPPRRIELSPYFISKYEMTYGQWNRISGASWVDFVRKNPTIDLRYPVQDVSWLDCDRIMRRLGLALPSEAQWECAARGGTQTVWWTGNSRDTLRGKVNLADQASKRAGYAGIEIDDWPNCDDGWPSHAPVGTFPPNGFGLHEVAGNVFEWCADGMSGPPIDLGTKDPLYPTHGIDARSVRGGAYNSAAKNLRSAFRGRNAEHYLSDGLGLRPARRVDP